MSTTKRVFGNRSNLTLHIDEDHRISLKRSSEESSNQFVAKKSKPEVNRRNKVDLENQGHVTKTILRKVKSITIGDEKLFKLIGSASSSLSTYKSKDGDNQKLAIVHEEAKSVIVKVETKSPLVKAEIKEESEVKPDIKSDIKPDIKPDTKPDVKPFSNRTSVIIKNENSSIKKSSPIAKIDFNDPRSYYIKPTDLPDDLDDYDYKQILDTYSEPHYVWDIFKYYQTKELQSLTKKYLDNQTEITKSMRAILVDWLVEVQQNYTLNHETLYLAVKMVDQYLMRVNLKKTDFQLLGATAMLIAAKYDERIPPAIEDFVYSCDNLYRKKDIILMEMEVLKKLDFNLGFPLSYRFLRRYARCAELSMEELTLARFILEMSLMEYELIEERESSVAAASLLLALRMKHFPKSEVWTKTLTYYSGYEENQLIPLMVKLNQVVSAPPKQALSSIRSKYSHRVFMEVAKISPLPKETVQAL